jgi:hypothetical protein
MRPGRGARGLPVPTAGPGMTIKCRRLVVGTVTLFVLGGERLQAPDLKTWTDDGELAWDSTPLLARLRGKKGDREIA